jgi:hypothetical protein
VKNPDYLDRPDITVFPGQHTLLTFMKKWFGVAFITVFEELQYLLKVK